MTFKELALIETLLRNVTDAGYTGPTEIQIKSIPVLLQGRDLLGIAQTGTGKTAAYSLPLIQRLLSSAPRRGYSSARALILAPTRELCTQIVESIHLYSKGLDLKALAIFGGVAQKSQVDYIKSGVDVIVATPGRLLDLYTQELLKFSNIEVLVLDEVDRMLDMGFFDDIEKVIQALPEKRQTMLFSATMPKEILKLTNNLLTSPVKVEVAPPLTTVEKIEQKIIFCSNDHKYQLLRKIIKEEPGLTLVFTTSKTQADLVAEYLIQNRIATGAVHADKKQSDRERHLQNFKNKAIKVLVATDLASRGIDIEGITHVINFDLPLTAETYVHRIGRTARAGSKGKAISFCDESELHLLEKIKRALKQEIPSEKFGGAFERLNLKASVARRIRPPTPGKSQEKTAYLDHSKRQKQKDEGEGKKLVHPGFRNNKKKRK